MDKKYVNFVREWKRLCHLYQKVLWNCKPPCLIEDTLIAERLGKNDLATLFGHWLLDFDKELEKHLQLLEENKPTLGEYDSDLVADCWTLHHHSKVDFVSVMTDAFNKPGAKFHRSHFVNHCKTIAGKGREHFLFADGVHPKCILMINRWNWLYKNIRLTRQEFQSDVDMLSDVFISKVADRQRKDQKHAKHDDIREAICFLYTPEHDRFSELDENMQSVVKSAESPKQTAPLYGEESAISFEQVEYIEAVEEQSLRLELCLDKLKSESSDMFQAVQMRHMQSEEVWGANTRIAKALQCSHTKVKSLLEKGILALRQCLRNSALTRISKNGSQ